MKYSVYRNVVEEPVDYLFPKLYSDLNPSEPYNQIKAMETFNSHFPKYLNEEDIKSTGAVNFTQ